MPFRESPYQQIKGINPMSEEEAKLRNHYRLSYDEDGRLSEYSFQLNDNLKNPGPHWYTEPGFIVAAKTKVLWKGKQEIRHYFDLANKRVSVDGVWEEVITYNAQGHRSSMKYFDEQGKAAENQNGVHHYSWKNHDALSVVESRYNKDGKATPTRDRFEYLTVKLNFNTQGWLVRIEHIDGHKQDLQGLHRQRRYACRSLLRG